MNMKSLRPRKTKGVWMVFFSKGNGNTAPMACHPTCINKTEYYSVQRCPEG